MYAGAIIRDKNFLFFEIGFVLDIFLSKSFFKSERRNIQIFFEVRNRNLGIFEKRYSLFKINNPQRPISPPN